MLATQSKIYTQQKNNIKFGNNKIPTSLVNEAKAAMRINGGFFQLKNGDSVSSVLGDGQLVLNQAIQSPDNLSQQSIVKLKKRLFGGFKVASAHLSLKHNPHNSTFGIVSESIGNINLKKAAKETREFLERIAKEDVATTALRNLNRSLMHIRKIK